MTLNNTTTLIVEAVPAKEFPHLWISSIHIGAPSVTKGRINIETLPYNSKTQELGLGKDMVSISTDDLWKAVNDVPEVATAMGAIFLAIEPLRTWVESEKVRKQAERAIANPVV